MKQRSLILLTAALTVGILLTLSLTVTNAQCGSSWAANYYNNTNLSGTPVGGVICLPTPSINTSAAPSAGVNNDGWSVRLVSSQTFVAGTYNFTVTADETTRIFLGTTLIVNYAGGSTFTTAIFIPAGTQTVTIEFVDTAGSSLLSVSWALVGATPVPGVTGTPAATLTPSTTPLPPIPAGALTGTVVRASVLNIRSAPGISAPAIGRVLRGQTYAIVGRDASARWFLLQLSGYQGWAFGYYLAFNGNEFTAPVVSASGGSRSNVPGVDPNATLIAVAQAGLRLRAAPDASSAQIGRIPWGEQLTIIGRSSDGAWWQTSWYGTIGWVYAPYLEIVSGSVSNLPVR